MTAFFKYLLSKIQAEKYKQISALFRDIGASGYNYSTVCSRSANLVREPLASFSRKQTFTTSIIARVILSVSLQIFKRFHPRSSARRYLSRWNARLQPCDHYYRIRVWLCDNYRSRLWSDNYRRASLLNDEASLWSYNYRKTTSWRRLVSGAIIIARLVSIIQRLVLR